MSRDRTLAESRAAADGPALDSDALTDTSGASLSSAGRMPRRRRGEAIGRYVILDPLGQGGMGVVYAAYDPELDRRVAVKLLRGANDRRAHARLLREAQAMARVIHPNVITVHDVGTISDNVFVAMELVDGPHLGDWVEAKPRTWQEIIDVFSQAGEGLLAAHRAGVLHRDFKPANVLVNREGKVRVLDFGLARQIEPTLDSSEFELDPDTESSRRVPDANLGLTRTGAVLGTPAYMAPEQHLRKPLDARTDQFAFCVALFEALFGERPFDGDTRVALAVATTRGERKAVPKGHPVPARIVRAVVRGLSSEPSERFASMTELLAELNYDPARRKRQVAVGALGVVALSVGIYGYAREPAATVGSSPCSDGHAALAGVWDADQHEAFDAAFAASGLPYANDTKRFVTDQLDRWTQTWSEARHDACEATKVRGEVPEAAYQQRIACLDGQRNDLAAVTRILIEGKPDALERADRLAASLPAPAACDDFATLTRLAPPSDEATAAIVEQVRAQLSEVRALETVGRYREGLDQAEAAFDQAARTEYQPLIAETRRTKGMLLDRTGKREEAEAMLHRAAHAAAEGRHDRMLVSSWLDLAWNLAMGQSRHDEALRWTEYAEAVINRMGRPDALTSRLLCTQGPIYWAKRENEEALRRLSDCLEQRERIMPGDPLIGNTLNYMGNSLIDLGRFEQAEAHYRRALDLARTAHGDTHPLVASTYNGIGVALYHQRRLTEAEEVYKKSYEINRALQGPDAPDLLYPLGNMAGCRRERGDFDEALEAMWRVEALVEKNFPPEHRETGTTAHNIAELLALQGELDRAMEYFERALPIRTKVHGEEHPFIANTLTGMGETLLLQDQAEQAKSHLERALAIRTKAEDPNTINMGRTRFALARALVATGSEPDRALELVRLARADYTTVDGKLQSDRRTAMDAWLAEHAPASPEP